MTNFLIAGIFRRDVSLHDNEIAYKKEQNPILNNDGWYILVDAVSRSVLSVTPMVGPENNDIKIEALSNVENTYPDVDI